MSPPGSKLADPLLTSWDLDSSVRIQAENRFPLTSHFPSSCAAHSRRPEPYQTSREAELRMRQKSRSSWRTMWRTDGIRTRCIQGVWPAVTPLPRLRSGVSGRILLWELGWRGMVRPDWYVGCLAALFYVLFLCLFFFFICFIYYSCVLYSILLY